MTTLQPYFLADPVELAANAVFNSPHSGRDYPESLLRGSRLTPHALRASEDALVDQLFSAAPALGAPLLAATAPRAWVDLNRGPSELDPALIDGVGAAGLNQRIAAGLGVIPRIVAEGTAIYDGKMTLAEAEARIDDVHRPYHAQLEALLRRAREQYGCAILFDCHSMPSDALRSAPRVRGRTPEIVLGDRFGAAASRAIMAETQQAFEAEGFIVARNAPFAGGYITQRYGRPSRGMHAIQIEIDRGLYLDRANLSPAPGFDGVRDRITSVVARLVAISGGATALAAE